MAKESPRTATDVKGSGKRYARCNTKLQRLIECIELQEKLISSVLWLHTDMFSHGVTTHRTLMGWRTNGNQRKGFCELLHEVVNPCCWANTTETPNIAKRWPSLNSIHI